MGWRRGCAAGCLCDAAQWHREDAVCLCCSLEAHPVHLCRGGTPFPWRCIPGNAESCQSLFQAPFTWLRWAAQGPFLGCTALKSWGDLLLASLHSQTWLCCYAQLLGNQRGPGHKAGSIPSLMGREGWIFTYRWASPIHRLWNWLFSFCVAVCALGRKSSPLRAIMRRDLLGTFCWGLRDLDCKRKKCTWFTHCPMSSQSDQKGLSCQSLKIISEQAPHSDLALTWWLGHLLWTSPHPRARGACLRGSHGIHLKLLCNTSYTYPTFQMDTLFCWA